jgi:polyisoprenoid-binding protein YceI
MSDASATPSSPGTRTVDGVEVPTPGTFVIDPVHTHLGFTIRHMMVAKVRGTFDSFNGTVVVAEDPADSTIEVTIDTASIDTRDEQRDAHLRSPDFFDVEKYPHMTFRSTAVNSKGGGVFIVDGDLTIRDVTRPIQLELEYGGVVQDPWGNQRGAVSATGEIDREDWGLRWNQPLEGGGIVLGKKVKLELEAEATRQA